MKPTNIKNDIQSASFYLRYQAQYLVTFELINAQKDPFIKKIFIYSFQTSLQSRHSS